MTINEAEYYMANRIINPPVLITTDLWDNSDDDTETSPFLFKVSPFNTGDYRGYDDDEVEWFQKHQEDIIER